MISNTCKIVLQNDAGLILKIRESKVTGAVTKAILYQYFIRPMTKKRLSISFNYFDYFVVLVGGNQITTPDMKSFVESKRVYITVTRDGYTDSSVTGG